MEILKTNKVKTTNQLGYKISTVYSLFIILSGKQQVFSSHNFLLFLTSERNVAKRKFDIRELCCCCVAAAAESFEIFGSSPPLRPGPTARVGFCAGPCLRPRFPSASCKHVRSKNFTCTLMAGRTVPGRLCL